MTDEETESFHLFLRDVSAKTGSLQRAPEVTCLPHVTETRHQDVKPVRTEQGKKPSDAHRSADRDDAHPLCRQVTAKTDSESFDGDSVAGAFDEHGGAQPEIGWQGASGRFGGRGALTVSGPGGHRGTKSLHALMTRCHNSLCHGSLILA